MQSGGWRPSTNYYVTAYSMVNGEQNQVARTGNLGSIQDVSLRVIKSGSAYTFAYSTDGATWTDVAEGTPVSMNLFGFTESFMGELKARLAPDLERILRENPMKGEYLLPVTVSRLLEEGKAHVAVLDCPEKWYGVTYKEDRPAIVAAMKEKKDAGLYPENLWE